MAHPDQTTDGPRDLVLEHLGLADALAHRYAGRGVDTEDLEQVARLALVKAARRYRTDRGDFAPFAAATIGGELKRHFRDRAWVVRPPRRLQEIQARLSAEHVGEVTSSNVDEIAGRLGLDPHEVSEASAARGCFHADSTDDPDHRRDLGVDDAALELVAEWQSVARPLRRLGREERQLLSWRFVDGLTQQAIADRLGISQMQVSRRLAKVIATLRSDVGAVAA